MRTTAEMTQILYDVLNASMLKTTVNGLIYKGERPINSTKEDVVIAPIVVSGSDKQIGVANVNIYVPKINQKSGATTSLIKDTKRISEILPVAKDALKLNTGVDYSCWIENQSEYDEPTINQTRLVFRIEFRLFM